jgi:Protein of unknown function (DUF2510)
MRTPSIVLKGAFKQRRYVAKPGIRTSIRERHGDYGEMMSQPPGPTAPAGWYPDPSTQAQLRYWDGFNWSGFTSPIPPPAPPPFVALNSWSPTDDETFVRQMSSYSHWSGVGWIMLGAFQILSLFGIIAGAWNIFAGISRIRFAGPIRERAPSVPQAVEGLAGYIIIGLINLFLGGVIGVVLVGVDLLVRDRILKRRTLFEQLSGEPDARLLGPSPASFPI